MKTNLRLVALLGFSALSFNAMAERNDSLDFSSQNGVNSQRYKDKMIQQCGHVGDVGNSSVFGDRGTHEKVYPGLGMFSAELDRVRNIDRDTYASLTYTLRQAKQDKDELRTGLQQNKNMRNRNIKSTSATQELRDKTDALYNQVQGDLLRRETYVMDKAASDVVVLLKSDGTPARGPNDTGSPSSYDKWNQCKAWWAYEKKTNLWDD